ncbi:MAG: cysteine desulfurase family protein [Planctomycetota bacterium]|nr:cysteine desulfurase family protein [Planctomycetota bacterium]
MRIYLDHNATTPLREEVIQAMIEMLRDHYGNPSSSHREGAEARRRLDGAREAVAALVGAGPGQVVFTGSATEANNAAIRGALRARRPGRVVTTTIEHPSVSEPLEVLAGAGTEVLCVPVDETGRVEREALARALREPTDLVVVILANNETGTIQDLPAIAQLARPVGAHLHVDATQALGKIPVSLGDLQADSLCGSAHKFNGPKGAGFLAARDGVNLSPFILGGPQERRRRGGTENTAGLVGLGKAADLAGQVLPERAREMARLRDRLWEGIVEKVPGVRRNGSAEHVLPNTLNVEFQGAAGDVLLEALDLEGVAVSAGAACASGSIEPSHVLSALGRSPEEARGALRFSTGHGNDTQQIDQVLALLPDLVARAREAAG